MENKNIFIEYDDTTEITYDKVSEYLKSLGYEQDSPKPTGHTKWTIKAHWDMVYWSTQQDKRGIIDIWYKEIFLPKEGYSDHYIKYWQGTQVTLEQAMKELKKWGFKEQEKVYYPSWILQWYSGDKVIHQWVISCTPVWEEIHIKANTTLLIGDRVIISDKWKNDYDDKPWNPHNEIGTITDVRNWRNLNICVKWGYDKNSYNNSQLEKVNLTERFTPIPQEYGENIVKEYATQSISDFKSTIDFEKITEAISSIREQHPTFNNKQTTTMNTFETIQSETFFLNEDNIKAIKDISEILGTLERQFNSVASRLKRIHHKIESLETQLHKAIEENDYKTLEELIPQMREHIEFLNEFQANHIEDLIEPEEEEESESSEELFA